VRLPHEKFTSRKTWRHAARFRSFSNEQEDAGHEGEDGQDELNLREPHPKPDKALKDEVDGEEKGSDAFGDFHG
jgi:hypothetical protein